MNGFKWSKTEKKIARAAFEKAYQLECSDIIEKIRTIGPSVRNDWKKEVLKARNI